MSGEVHGHLVKVLFDTGSTHNVINSSLVKKLKLKTTPSAYTYRVELADGKGSEIWDRRVVGLPVQIQTYKDELDFEIVRLARFDLVLSKQWHASKKPTIDFQTHIYQFNHNGHRIIIRGDPDVKVYRRASTSTMVKSECKYLYFLYLEHKELLNL
ncbi:hypothetical protein KP509_38G032300 [Ceratopteris richardii]|uniref:Uncharacterized protein n=1 Tax=Ceratopteris richardii TaxID=49495 RepID=A0A8T2Q3R4_CERRI|nr:hypothetical protein KP509_38G032300 [Ceratopteris richardii]